MEQYDVTVLSNYDGREKIYRVEARDENDARVEAYGLCDLRDPEVTSVDNVSLDTRHDDFRSAPSTDAARRLLDTAASYWLDEALSTESYKAIVDEVVSWWGEY